MRGADYDGESAGVDGVGFKEGPHDEKTAEIGRKGPGYKSEIGKLDGCTPEAGRMEAVQVGPSVDGGRAGRPGK